MTASRFALGSTIFFTSHEAQPGYAPARTMVGRVDGPDLRDALGRTRLVPSPSETTWMTIPTATPMSELS